MKLVTNKFKSGGLHEKHVVATCNLGNHLIIFVCILLGISPASDCGLPTFRNPLSVPSSRAGCKV